MKATDLLKEQHREVSELFARLEGPVGARAAEEIVREIATVIGAHMLIEQELFYPACAQAMSDRELVRHPYAEHAEAAAELRKLLAMAGDFPEFPAQVKKVKAMIDHHVGEEEREFFPKVEPAVGDKELELLGGYMEARFDEGIELGHEVTTAETQFDPKDVDMILAQYQPRGERVVPMNPGDRQTRKDVPAAVRRAAKSASVPGSSKDHGGRRPKSGAEGARKTREGDHGPGSTRG